MSRSNKSDNRWQKALDNYNERQMKQSPAYKARYKEQELQNSERLKKARERQKQGKKK